MLLNLIDNHEWYSQFIALRNNFKFWIQHGYLTVEEIKHSNIIDFGGSWGQLALIFLIQGANKVVVVDTSLPRDFYQSNLNIYSNLEYTDTLIEDYAECQKNESSFDMVISHTVTEHINEPAKSFAAIYRLLKPGGLFFIVHDNYYHPSGAHDNIMLQGGADGYFGYQGPRCWEDHTKCAYSLEFRLNMTQNLPWIWDTVAEKLLTPDNCDNCLFYKRTHPWAHLLFQKEFNRVFPQKCFSSGQNNSMLNKITPFQLYQYLIEAGFDIDLWKRSYVNNSPPQQLMMDPFFFSEPDLKTINVYARCRKP